MNQDRLVMFCFGLAPALAPSVARWLQSRCGLRAPLFFLAACGVLLTQLNRRFLPVPLPTTKG